MSYMTISSQENHHFLLCSYFHAHPTTLLLKILGGTNAWAVPPTSNFGGDRPPQSPPRSPPLDGGLLLRLVIKETEAGSVADSQLKGVALWEMNHRGRHLSNNPRG